MVNCLVKYRGVTQLCSGRTVADVLANFNCPGGKLYILDARGFERDRVKVDDELVEDYNYKLIPRNLSSLVYLSELMPLAKLAEACVAGLSSNDAFGETKSDFEALMEMCSTNLAESDSETVFIPTSWDIPYVETTIDMDLVKFERSFEEEKFAAVKVSLARQICESTGEIVDPDDIIILQITDGSSKVKWILNTVKFKAQGAIKTMKMFVASTKEAAKQVLEMDSAAVKFKNAFVKPNTKFDCNSPDAIAKYHETKTAAIEMHELFSGKHRRFVREQVNNVDALLQEATTRSHYELKVIDTTMLVNQQLFKEFAEHEGDIQLLFHGTAGANYKSIASQGFTRVQELDEGWYGRGVYLTSYLEYALMYDQTLQGDLSQDFAERLAPDEQATVLVCAVKLGNTREITELHNGKAIKSGYHSNHVKVAPPRFTPAQAESQPGDIVYDEFVVADRTRVLPMYVITVRRQGKALVWRDPNVHNSENSELLKRFQTERGYSTYSSTDDAGALDILSRKGPRVDVKIMTNGGNNGKDFVAKVLAMNQASDILVFCGNPDHKKWIDKFERATMSTTHEGVFEWLDENMSHATL